MSDLRTCEDCGGPLFEKARRDARYCGDLCRKRAHRDRNGDSAAAKGRRVDALEARAAHLLAESSKLRGEALGCRERARLLRAELGAR